jgi:hypothetical protein
MKKSGINRPSVGPICRTRYPELCYQRQWDLWRIVTAEDEATVGPQYRTRAELLGDLERYAGVYGCH